MKKNILLLLGFVLGSQVLYAQAKLPNSAIANVSKEEQEILDLSKSKWLWMSEKNTELLADFFTENSVFVHMGGSWGKTQELNVIKNGGIWYKKAEVYGASVNLFDDVAILLNEIDLVAVVGGNEVVNPFMVTEVFIKEKDKWKMGSLTFSKLNRPVKIVSSTSK